MRMSYNITRSLYISGRLTIDKWAAVSLLRLYLHRLPENSFLQQLDLDGDAGEALPIEHPSWSGAGSGATYHDALRYALEHTSGEAVLGYVWEGGDQFTGLHIKDGAVTDIAVALEASQ